MVWYSHLLKNFSVCCDPHSQRLWHSQWSRSRSFSGTLAFLMIHQMLAIWSLVPLSFLNSAWTFGISQFTSCCSLAWRILSIILLACEMQLCGSLSILWHCLSLGLEWKLTWLPCEWIISLLQTSESHRLGLLCFRQSRSGSVTEVESRLPLDPLRQSWVSRVSAVLRTQFPTEVKENKEHFLLALATWN